MKLSSLILFGAGYVLGSKAGRERYEQIVMLVGEAAQGLDQKSARDRILAYADGGKPLVRTASSNGSVVGGPQQQHAR